MKYYVVYKKSKYSNKEKHTFDSLTEAKSAAFRWTKDFGGIAIVFTRFGGEKARFGDTSIVNPSPKLNKWIPAHAVRVRKDARGELVVDLMNPSLPRGSSKGEWELVGEFLDKSTADERARSNRKYGNKVKVIRGKAEGSRFAYAPNTLVYKVLILQKF